jgi:hypothetical protein
MGGKGKSAPEQPSEAVANTAKSDLDEKTKQERKLKKQLRQVEELEAARDAGTALNADQQGKISKKQSLLQALADLKL